MTDTDRTAAIRLAKDAGVFIPVRYRDGKTEPVSEPFERFRQLCRAELLAEQAAQKPVRLDKLWESMQAAKPADGCAHCNSPLFCATKCGSCGKSFEEASPLPEEVANRIELAQAYFKTKREFLLRFATVPASYWQQYENLNLSYAMDHLEEATAMMGSLADMLQSLAAENAALQMQLKLKPRPYADADLLIAERDEARAERDALQRQIDEARK